MPLPCPENKCVQYVLDFTVVDWLACAVKSVLVNILLYNSDSCAPPTFRIVHAQYANWA